MDVGHIIGLIIFLAIIGGGVYWALKHPETPDIPGSDNVKGDKPDIPGSDNVKDDKDDLYNRR